MIQRKISEQTGYDLFRLGEWAGNDYTYPGSPNAIFWSVSFEKQKQLQQENPTLADAWDSYLSLLAMVSDK